MFFYKGYINFGNSCFFNSAIQALLSLKFFREKIGHTDLFMKDSLRDFAMSLPWYKPGQQNCAHDTLLNLISTFKLEKFFITEYEKIKICSCGIKNLDKDIVITHLTPSIEHISGTDEIVNNCTDCGAPTYRLMTQLKISHNAIIINLNKFQQRLPESICLKTIGINNKPNSIPQIDSSQWPTGYNHNTNLRDEALTRSDESSEQRGALNRERPFYVKYDLKCVIYHYGTPNGGHYFVKVVGDDKKIVQIDDSHVSISNNIETHNAHVAVYELSSI